MKKIDQFFLWLYARSIRAYLFWILLLAGIVIAMSLANALIGFNMSTTSIVLIIWVAAWAVSGYYSENALAIRYAEERISHIEYLLETGNMESPALSGLWELCMNTSGKYDDLFISSLFAERFHDRLFAIVDKLKAAHSNQYRGVRSLDFVMALDAAITNVEEDVEQGERKHFHVVLVEKLQSARAYVVDQFVKPQEHFFIESSDVTTYNKYLTSLRFRYDEAVLPADELQKKVNAYFDAMTREECFNLFAATVNHALEDGDPSSNIRWQHLANYLAVYPQFKDAQLLCARRIERVG